MRPDNTDEGVAVATYLVQSRFPEARAAWLGGSVAVGEQTSSSDLDVTVLLDGPPASYRSSEVIDGWPVEFFVQTEESLLRFCDADRQRRRPTTMRLVGSSVVVVDRDGSGHRLQQALNQMDRDGPQALTADELEAQRYAITDLLSDLVSARTDDERLVVAAHLTHGVMEFVLAANRRWSGTGKWLLREITALDRELHTRHGRTLTNGLRAATAGGPEQLHDAVVAILDQHGGPVFDGFRRVGPLPELEIRPMTADDARQITAWRYDGRWAVYNVSSATLIIDHLADYLAVTGAGELVGFCCTGDAARVPGMTAEAGTLDVGLGMHPARTGQGHGLAFGRAVLEFITSTHPGMELRAVVQDWNERSLRLLHRLGFVDVGALSASQVGYRILVSRQKIG